MGWFDKKQDKKQEISENLTQEAFSGYRYDIPKNSNLPIVWNQIKRDGFIQIGWSGSDQFFPLVVEQSIYESAPSHSACIKFAVLSTMGAGYTFSDFKTITEEKDVKVFEKTNCLKKLVREITQDYRLHNRINIIVTKNNNGSLKFDRISPAKIGYNQEKTKFYYSRDYSTTTYTHVYYKYESGCAPGKYMLEFDGYVDKYDPYPTPEWLCGFKHIKINSRIPEFHEANMSNSINPNLVIKRIGTFKDQTEKNQWFKTLFGNKGVDHTGNTMLFSAPSEDLLPIVEQLSANQNDKLFKELRESSIDDICMSHNINPILIGVKTPGALGANQEAELAYQIFLNVVVEDMRLHIEYVINELMCMSNLTTTFKLNEKTMFTVNSEQNFKNKE